MDTLNDENVPQPQEALRQVPSVGLPQHSQWPPGEWGWRPHSQRVGCYRYCCYAVIPQTETACVVSSKDLVVVIML